MLTRPLPPEPRGPWPRWIERQLVRRGIGDERVLAAFRAVDRAWFVSAQQRPHATSDAPLPIGCRQTVSQPYVVALSLQAMELTGTERVLEIGTGSGYQTVLLSHLAREVYTIEVFQELYFSARMAIERHAPAPVFTHHGDGSRGWAEAAPFDAIVAGCYARRAPEALLEQLAPGGRLVMPLGTEHSQVLYRIRRNADGSLERTALERVLFVPLRQERPEGR